MNFCFIWERAESQELKPLQIATSMQIVDLLTKGLGTQQLRFASHTYCLTTILEYYFIHIYYDLLRIHIV